MAGDHSAKTEKPTPQRLKKAREQGQFLSARSFVSALQFVALLIILANWLPKWESQIEASTRTVILRAFGGDIGPEEWPVLIQTLFTDTLLPIAEAGGLLLLITIGIQLSLTKFGFSLARLTPKFENFNPVTRLRELPKQNLWSLLEAVLLLVVVGLSVQSIARDNVGTFLRLPLQSVHVATAQVSDALQNVLWKAAGVFVVFGSIDLFRQYQKHMSGLRMSKQEIRDELKRQEGDPYIKARVRRLRRDLLRRQMMKEVPKATAVLVNPTHYAVAIRYEMDTMACPVVVAKGRNWLALRIRAIATSHNIPIIENPPLARALYQAADVGQAIPAEFYRAIAEVLAYVYKLMGHKVPA
ncbi:MAG TPA: EscU/YscU/HrcU family type III secretion system export apparatus switch protein [Bryobacteraceae bacterium]|nr:EscU/YscU/HrcU family type III secretion system export apparatus switch protein [Bryobacteraceae bacterium]